MWTLCQIRASPGKRHCFLPFVEPSQAGAPSAEQAESGPGATRVGSRLEQAFARWGEAALSPASLGFGPATPMQPGAPSAAQADSGPDPTLVGSRPDPGFTR